MALFFMDRHGGHRIGVVFNPIAIKESYPFRVDHPFPVDLITVDAGTDKGKKKKASQLVKVHVASMVRQMALLCGDLIESVQVHPKLSKQS
jgi:hypothetical protein